MGIPTIEVLRLPGARGGFPIRRAQVSVYTVLVPLALARGCEKARALVPGPDARIRSARLHQRHRVRRFPWSGSEPHRAQRRQDPGSQFACSGKAGEKPAVSSSARAGRAAAPQGCFATCVFLCALNATVSDVGRGQGSILTRERPTSARFLRRAADGQARRFGRRLGAVGAPVRNERAAGRHER